MKRQKIMKKIKIDEFKQLYVNEIECKEIRHDATNTLIINYFKKFLISAYFIKGRLQQWYMYESEEDRQIKNNLFIEKQINKLKEKAQEKEAAKAKKIEMSKKIEIGTILYSSWGYDQTNVDFYQVVEKKGLKVVIREIRQISSKEKGFTAYVEPLKDKFIGEPEAHIINQFGLKIRSYIRLSIYDGKPKYTSSYH